MKRLTASDRRVNNTETDYNYQSTNYNLNVKES